MLLCGKVSHRCCSGGKSKRRPLTGWIEDGSLTFVRYVHVSKALDDEPRISEPEVYVLDVSTGRYRRLMMRSEEAILVGSETDIQGSNDELCQGRSNNP